MAQSILCKGKENSSFLKWLANPLLRGAIRELWQFAGIIILEIPLKKPLTRKAVTYILFYILKEFLSSVGFKFLKIMISLVRVEWIFNVGTYWFFFYISLSICIYLHFIYIVLLYTSIIFTTPQNSYEWIVYLLIFNQTLVIHILYLAYFIDSCKDKDIELSTLIKNANSAREYFRILKERELFTPSDVIFMQFLLRESNCGVLNEKCIAYAKTQKALCFYEEPPSKFFF